MRCTNRFLTELIRPALLLMGVIAAFTTSEFGLIMEILHCHDLIIEVLRLYGSF